MTRTPLSGSKAAGRFTDKIVFHKTAPELQVQDRSVQYQDHSLQDPKPFFWSQTGLVLRVRPTVSDHITGRVTNYNTRLIFQTKFQVDVTVRQGVTSRFAAKTRDLVTVAVDLFDLGTPYAMFNPSTNLKRPSSF